MDNTQQKSLDKLQIEGIQLPLYIGCLPWEQQSTQTLIVTVTISLDLRAAGHSDDLTKTLDYSVLHTNIQALKNSRIALIEAVAEKIAQIVLADPRVEQVTVQVKKPHILALAQSVSAQITRDRLG